jgi:UDP-N-acetylglucosamine:LPS N-acetylglucosamine transferase
MSEAVHIGVPFFAVPLRQQFEQELNARYLSWLGYGDWAPDPDPDRLRTFLASTDDHAQALERYPRQDNACTLGCVDELIRRAADGEPRPVRLSTPAMGAWLAED